MCQLLGLTSLVIFYKSKIINTQGLLDDLNNNADILAILVPEIKFVRQRQLLCTINSFSLVAFQQS